MLPLRRLGLFGWVFLLFTALCVVPALALLWVTSGRIDAVLQRQGKSESRVMSFVNSAGRAVRNAAATAVRLPEDFSGILEKFRAVRAPEGPPPEQAEREYRERVLRQLDRLVCATEAFRLGEDQKKVVAGLLALMDPDPARARPTGKDLDRVLETCFPPLDDYRLGSQEQYRAELARLQAHSWNYETLADTNRFTGEDLPACNAVFLLDEDGRVVRHNRKDRYGREIEPDRWIGKTLDALAGAGDGDRAAAERLGRMLAVLKAEEEAAAKRAGVGPPDPTGGVQVVGEAFEGLDVLGRYTDPRDYRRRCLPVMATLRGPLSPDPRVRYVLFLVNWSLIECGLVSDQTYKRSRNADTLRMTLWEATGGAGGPKRIASGDPGGHTSPRLVSAVAAAMPAGRETRPAEVVEFRFDENGDGVGDGDEMIGGVRAVESPADPPRWRVRYVRPDGSDAGGFRWVVAIWYDPTEGSVAPLVRQQVLILSAALLGVMLAACWVVGRRLSRPINALRRMAGELAAGRYRPADRPPDEAGAESAFAAAPREIRDLDRAFLDMAAQVVSKQALEQANAELHEKNRRLDEAVARLTATEEQLRKGQRELEDKARTLEETIRRLNDTQQELLVSNMLASLGVISGEYAHAVNNGLQLPMATLEQLAADLDKLQLPAALREDILSSVDSLKSTAAFVTQFRDFARSDNYAMEPLDLNRVLESVAAGWKPQMRRKQIELETDPGRPPLIQGNDSLLMHVLLNLLLNARDAIRQRRQEAPPGSPERRLTGRIRLATSADEDGSAVLSVTDNGCGIPPEIAPRIFQAMFTTKPKGEGSGLGLSSVLRAVRQHKGQIWFESKPGPGGGTTFFIRFPALKAG